MKMKLIKVTNKKKDASDEVWTWIFQKRKSIKKYPHITPGFSISLYDANKTDASVNWSAIGEVSVPEAEEFAKNILSVCAELRKADKEAQSKWGLKSGI